MSRFVLDLFLPARSSAGSHEGGPGCHVVMDALMMAVVGAAARLTRCCTIPDARARNIPASSSNVAARPRSSPASMSRAGNVWDQLGDGELLLIVKTERTARKVYRTPRRRARADVFGLHWGGGRGLLRIRGEATRSWGYLSPMAFEDRAMQTLTLCPRNRQPAHPPTTTLRVIMHVSQGRLRERSGDPGTTSKAPTSCI